MAGRGLEMGAHASASSEARLGKIGSDEESGSADKSGFRRPRLGIRHAGSGHGSGSLQKQIKEEQFSGIAKIQLISVSP